MGLKRGRLPFDAVSIQKKKKKKQQRSQPGAGTEEVQPLRAILALGGRQTVAHSGYRNDF